MDHLQNSSPFAVTASDVGLIDNQDSRIPVVKGPSEKQTLASLNPGTLGHFLPTYWEKNRILS